ncbi:MAG: PEP-CTERM sorting domain-containing protein [Pirellulales bacterium]|nr:PEP-CTERM sorting domain-containing protein [Pirellulales bacterium]
MRIASSSRIVCALVLISFLSLTWQPPGRRASAEQIAISISTYGGSLVTQADVMVGWSFIPQSHISITKLGWFDGSTPNNFVSYGNGLEAATQVGLWDFTSKALLASTTVKAGTASQLVGKFRYEPISPVALEPGRKYMIAGFLPYVPNLTNWRYLAQDWEGGPQLHAAVSYVTAYAPTHSSFGFPATYRSTFNLYDLGPNFMFVPEPSSVVLFFVGLTWLSVLCLRMSACRRVLSRH